MTEMYYVIDGLLFIDMYEMMGNKTAQLRLNWISYLGIVFLMKKTECEC